MHGIFSKIGLVRRIGGRPCLDGVMFERITHEDNTMLIGKFGEMEIQEAIWECGSAKSLGPNGYNFRFIKKFWETIKGDVFNFLNDFHDSANFVRGANASFTSLIRKNDDPQGCDDYRPIFLVGCKVL